MTFQHRVTTSRLNLIGADAPLLHAELTSHTAIAEVLQCAVLPSWPPELYETSAVRWSLTAVQNLAAASVWRTYYIVQRASKTLIGIGGFKGVPDHMGTVEIGYSILAEFQCNGYATEATRALVDLAYQSGAGSVFAETLPALIASQRVLEKSGFVLIGAGSEDGVIRFRHLKSLD
jgi:[ribosomal protein S5]-alanine N-acetyltransferase